MTKVLCLPAGGADKTNTNPNNFTFTIKTQGYKFLQQLYQQKIIKSYQKLSVKDLKDQFIGMNKNKN